MTTINKQKIKTLMENHQQGTVCLATWLEGLGISHDLQIYYRKSGWLESVGRGAFKRPNESIDWRGALHSLQYQTKFSVHAGALTALSIQGFAHYIRFETDKIFLFSPLRVTLPSWFRNHNWQTSIEHIKTSVFPKDLGLIEYMDKTFNIIISSPERAILECLHLAPKTLDLMECYQLLEGLPSLRPKVLQELLEACTSVKVKRLFLYMAKKANHQWIQFLDSSTLDLGKGDRSIIKGGTYISKYQISIPKELTE